MDAPADPFEAARREIRLTDHQREDPSYPRIVPDNGMEVYRWFPPEQREDAGPEPGRSFGRDGDRLHLVTYDADADVIRLNQSAAMLWGYGRAVREDPAVRERWNEFTDWLYSHRRMLDRTLPGSDRERSALATVLEDRYGVREGSPQRTVRDLSDRDRHDPSLNSLVLGLEMMRERADPGLRRRMDRYVHGETQIALESALLRRFQETIDVPEWPAGVPLREAWMSARRGAFGTVTGNRQYLERIERYLDGDDGTGRCAEEIVAGPGDPSHPVLEDLRGEKLDRMSHRIGGEERAELIGRARRALLFDHQDRYRGAKPQEGGRRYRGFPVEAVQEGIPSARQVQEDIEGFAARPPRTRQEPSPNPEPVVEASAADPEPVPEEGPDGTGDAAEEEMGVELDLPDIGPMGNPQEIYQDAIDTVNDVFGWVGISSPPDLVPVRFLDAEMTADFHEEGIITFGQYDPREDSITVYVPPLKIRGGFEAMAEDREVRSAMESARDELVYGIDPAEEEEIRDHLLEEVYGIGRRKDEVLDLLEETAAQGETFGLNQVALMIDISRLGVPGSVRSRVDDRYRFETQLTMEHELLHQYQIDHRIPIDVGEAVSHAWTRARRNDLGPGEGAEELKKNLDAPVYREVAPDAPAHADNIVEQLPRRGNDLRVILGYQEDFRGEGTGRIRPGIGVPSPIDLFGPAGIDALGGISTGSPLADFVIDRLLE